MEDAGISWGRYAVQLAGQLIAIGAVNDAVPLPVRSMTCPRRGARDVIRRGGHPGAGRPPARSTNRQRRHGRSDKPSHDCVVSKPCLISSKPRSTVASQRGLSRLGRAVSGRFPLARRLSYLVEDCERALLRNSHSTDHGVGLRHRRQRAPRREATPLVRRSVQDSRYISSVRPAPGRQAIRACACRAHAG